MGGPHIVKDITRNVECQSDPIDTTIVANYPRKRKPDVRGLDIVT